MCDDDRALRVARVALGKIRASTTDDGAGATNDIARIRNIRFCSYCRILAARARTAAYIVPVLLYLA